MDTSTDEPPAKRIVTDYTLCVVCQKKQANQKLVDTTHSKFNDRSYTNVLTAVRTKAEFGNAEYTSMNRRLYNITAVDLKNNGASWHSECYKSALRNIQRDKYRAEEANACNDPHILTRKKGRPSIGTPTRKIVYHESVKKTTRTSSTIKNFDKTKCIFCQNDKDEDVVQCQSRNKGKEIQKIIENSGNVSWKISISGVLSNGDLLANDIMYHKSCSTTNWEKYVQRPKRKHCSNYVDACGRVSESFEYIAAETQFYTSIKEELDGGAILSLQEVQIRYKQIMSEYEINPESDSTYIFKQKLQKNIPNVTITPSCGNKPSKISSKHTCATAIDDAASSQIMAKSLYDCAKYLRCTIKKSNCLSWEFSECVDCPVSDFLPNELVVFVKWLIHGTKVPHTTIRNAEMNRSANLLSQQILQHFKSDRQTAYPETKTKTFHQRVETPLAVGISLQSHHLHRSKTDIDILNAASIGISYSRVKDITTQIANSTLKSMKDYAGTYVPPLLLQKMPIRASADNLDKKVDTPDGKNSFHGTAMSVYQAIKPDINVETVRDKLLIDPLLKTDYLKDVPETVIELRPCRVQGNPKPKTSPKYENYNTGQHNDEVIMAQTNDLMWLVARFIHRAEVPKYVANESENCQSIIIPVWRAYNSLIATQVTQSTIADQAHALPIINAPAHEWPTLVTVLENLHKLNKIVCPDNHNQKVMVTFDMDLYKRAFKLEFLEEQYSGKWWLLPGSFHTSLCAIRCLGRTIECSGIDELWIKSGIYGEVVTNQIINGSHYNRAVEAHEITLQLLADLWLESFFESHPDVITTITNSVKVVEIAAKSENPATVKDAHESMLTELGKLRLEEKLHAFDELNDQFPMYKWCRNYMRQIMTLLAFHRSVKDSQLFLYLASLEELATYFFAYNRLDYAQHILEFVARAYNARTTDPDMWIRLCAGEFTFSSNVPFTSIGLDQAQEHQNKLLKGDGGINGITNKPATFLKYCLAAPELAKLSKQTNDMLGLSKQSIQTHHLQSSTAKDRQEKMIARLKDELKCNPFKDKGNDLYNIMTKKVLRQEAKLSILETVDRGIAAKEKFVEERIRGNTSLWEKMKRVKLLTWSDLTKKPKHKETKSRHMNTTASLLSRMLVVAKSDRSLDLKNTVSNYEFLEINQMLMKDDGTLRPCQNKSELLHALEGLIKTQDQIVNETQDNNQRHLIIDGMQVVQAILHTGKLTNCDQLSTTFTKSIEGLLNGYFCGRIIFDNYQRQTSIKDMLRYKECISEDVIIADSTPIDGKLDMMSNNKSKDRLTLYLANKLLQQSQCKVVTVTRENVRSNSSDIQPTTGVSSQEEADTLMILHAIEITSTGASVDFYTQDTDWFVLILRRFEQIGHMPRILTGTRDSRRKVELTPIFNELGSDKSNALPGMHALTGSDTTGHIYGVSKKRALKILLESDEAILTSLAKLGTEDYPSEDVIAGCMSYLCMLVGNQHVHATRDPGELRWKKFKAMSSAQGVDKLPPTAGSWHQHILRAHMQARIWHQNVVLNPTVPDALNLGWEMVGELKLKPVLSMTQMASSAVIDLVHCNCGVSKCARRCSCKQNNILCTELCKCEGNEECCNVNQIAADI